MKKIATSHSGRYHYYAAPDRYIYQYDSLEDRMIGWFCSLEAWERTFSHSVWIKEA